MIYTLPTEAQDSDHDAIDALALAEYPPLRRMEAHETRTLYVRRDGAGLALSVAPVGVQVGTYTCLIDPSDLRDDIADAVREL